MTTSEKIAKAIENKTCFLCDAVGTDVPAVTLSPYGYAVCATCAKSDFDEFVSDYS